jgi:CheY-like chemotaxis protein
MADILIVEDNEDSRDMIGRILRFHQINYDAVESAEAALERLEDYQYSGLIIDLALPEMDGWSLLGVLQKQAQTADLPCIAVTAYHSAELANKALQKGFVAYFSKPLEKTVFANTILRMLEH